MYTVLPVTGTLMEYALSLLFYSSDFHIDPAPVRVLRELVFPVLPSLRISASQIG